MNSTRRNLSRSDALWVLALYGVSAASFPFAALIVDSGRDLAWGWSIAQGVAWPWYGPSLNGLWQPGPIWYYALALALKLTGSIGGTAWLVGMVAALKIPMAYALGREWSPLQPGSREVTSLLGVSLAAAMALPGWNTLGQLALSHTSLVEVAVVATLWMALRAWRLTHPGALIASGLALGLAVHAHPTALVAAPAVALAAWRVLRARSFGWLIPLAIAFALPFLPALLAEARAGWPQADASAGYFGGSDYVSRLSRAPQVLWGASVGSVGFVREFLLGRWPGAAFCAAVALAALYATTALGLVASLRRDRANAAVLALAALAWWLVLLLRDSTPVWMVYACAPFNAALLALGWHAWWRDRAPRASAHALAAFAMLLSGAVLADRVFVSRSGVQWFPSAALADIAQPLHRDPPIRFWLPAFGHDALAKRICEAGAPVALHGDLATAVHFGQGVAVALHCAHPEAIRLGGSASRQLVGVPSAIAQALGLRGEATDWGYVLLAPRVSVVPSQGTPVRVHTRYLMDTYRARTSAGPTILAIDHACEAGELLVVTNLLPGLNAPFELRSRDGSPLPLPLAETIASRYFDCPTNGLFGFDLSALDSAAVDVFVLERGK